jgi:hypothetical protein
LFNNETLKTKFDDTLGNPEIKIQIIPRFGTKRTGSLKVWLLSVWGRISQIGLNLSLLSKQPRHQGRSKAFTDQNNIYIHRNMTDRKDIQSVPVDGGAPQKSFATPTTGRNDQDNNNDKVWIDTKELPVWNYQVSVTER